MYQENCLLFSNARVVNKWISMLGCLSYIDRYEWHITRETIEKYPMSVISVKTNSSEQQGGYKKQKPIYRMVIDED